MDNFILDILGNITQIIEHYSYIIIFLFMAIESSFIPFPSELVMIPAGYLIAKGKLSFSYALLSGILGSIAGALVNYHLARTIGSKLLYKYGKFFFISSEKLTKIEKFFSSHGSISTFSGRLIPGIRQYISFPAGLASMCQKRFIFFTCLGSAIWVAILIIVGVICGNNEELIKSNLRIITITTIALVSLLISFYAIYHKRRSRLSVIKNQG